jgi:excisionase family DNA binding protein
MNPPVDPPRLADERMLTVRETCALLGVSRRQIDRWMTENGLQAIFVGRERRFPVWYLRAFEASLLGMMESKVEDILGSGGNHLTRRAPPP